MRESEAQQCIPALKVEPAADMRAVIFNCSNADAKFSRDGTRAHSCGYELNYSALGCGKVF